MSVISLHGIQYTVVTLFQYLPENLQAPLFDLHENLQAPLFDLHENLQAPSFDLHDIYLQAPLFD